MLFTLYTSSIQCVLPGAGMALGGKMMGSQKLHKAGRLIFAVSAGVAGGMGMSAGYSLMKTGVTNISNGLEEGRIDLKGMAQVLLGSTIACLSGISMYYNFKGLLSTGDNLARSSRISETASETMESGKGCKGSTNAVEPPSAYGKGHDIETNGFGPDTIINRNANYGAKAADPSYGVATKSIGDYQLGTNNPSRNYVTGTSRTGMAAGAEENIWLKAGNGTGVSGTPGRKVPGSLGSTGLDVWKPKVPDVPEIGGRGLQKDSSEHLLGANGTRTDGSLTIKRNGKTERVDVENMAPGKRPGDVHYHEDDDTKWRYDVNTGQLVNPDNSDLVAPPRVQKVTKENWFKKAIKKAMKILGE